MPTGPRAIKPQASVWLDERAAGVRRRRQAAVEPAGTSPGPSPDPTATAQAPPDAEDGDPGAAGIAAADGPPADGHTAAARAPSGAGAAGQPGGGVLDLDRIVRTTIRMLDAEGLARFSMRRLAAELGVTPMSVYWYVDNKDDLLEIALDDIAGEVPVPAEGGGADWRAQVREVATGYRRMLVAHPWAPRLMGEYLNLGPKAAAFATAMYRVMRRTGLPEEMIPGALSTVQQFTYGFGTVEGRWRERCRAAGLGEDELFGEMSGAVRDHPAFHGPAALIDRRAHVALAELRERDFAFALDCIVAGIEAMRERPRD